MVSGMTVRSLGVSCKLASRKKRPPTLHVQENLQMGVTVAEVKDYLEFWLTRKTSDLQKEHEQQMASIKVPLPVLHTLEMININNRQSYRQKRRLS